MPQVVTFSQPLTTTFTKAINVHFKMKWAIINIYAGAFPISNTWQIYSTASPLGIYGQVLSAAWPVHLRDFDLFDLYFKATAAGTTLGIIGMPEEDIIP